MIEIVPLRLEQADRIEVLALEIDPVEIVEPVIPQRRDVVLNLQCGSFEQSRSMTEVARGSVILSIARPRAAPDRLALQIAGEKLGNVADREDVGIGDESAPWCPIWSGIAKRSGVND